MHMKDWYVILSLGTKLRIHRQFDLNKNMTVRISNDEGKRR